jgi:hypothetical protein
MYNHAGRFRLVHRGRLGWIAVWADLRDDDLMSLSDLPAEVTLRRADDARRTLRVRFVRNRRVVLPPVVQHAAVTLHADRQPRLALVVRTDRTPHELDVNVWRVHLAALDCDEAELVVPLLRADWADFRHDGVGAYELSVPLEPAWLAANARYLDERGRLAHGTSLWFENVVGQVARPERLDFAVESVREPELEPARR